MNLFKKMLALLKHVRTAHDPRITKDDDLDTFYIRFEERFRGSESEITDRLSVYLTRLKDASETGLPILDIGSGRGELLQLLQKENLQAIGIDNSPQMIRHAREKGLDVVCADALEFLDKKETDSFGAITAIHLLEHLPFPTLFGLVKQCLRCVSPGGSVIIETPNPENVTVGAASFYNDPTHIRPLPPALIQFLFEYLGFTDVEILYFRPTKTISDKTTQDPEIARRMFGPTDYAVIGKKPPRIMP